jgi:IS5 family transposase
MRGHENPQADFLSHAVYDAMIPAGHLFRRLRALLDWGGLAAELEDCYRHRGRPSVPPEVMLRIMILQYLYDRSDRQIEEDLRMHIGFKFFAGLAPDEAGPDHSTLSRFRGRVGNERFVRIFNKIVQAARQAGVIADRLHAIDARAVKANVATWRRRDRDDDDDSPPGLVRFDDTPPGSPDPDAKWGAKSTGKYFHGYKHHLAVDADSGMIVVSAVTPGNRNDGAEMPTLVDDRAGAITADKAYDSRTNHRLLARHGIGDRIIRKKGDNGSANKLRWVVERTNAIVKRWCGGGRARYWSLEKVSIQMTLASVAANLKRWLGMTAPVAPATG